MPAPLHPPTGGRSKNTKLKKTNKQNTKTRPSVRTAKVSANEPETDGGTDERAAEEEPPQAPPIVAVAPTEGVLLLTAIGNEQPAFRLTGKVLRDQGLAVDGLMSLGWTPEQIRHVVAGRPLPEKLTKTLGAVISSRIGAAAASSTPAAAPVIPRQAQDWHDHDPGPDEETFTAPAFGKHITPSRFYGCTDESDGIPCEKPCNPVTGLCPQHTDDRARPQSAPAPYEPAPLVFIGEPTEVERLVDLGGWSR
ncbi:hypothetical protein ACWCYZ_45495 [Streptomyces virginiae]